MRLSDEARQHVLRALGRHLRRHGGLLARGQRAQVALAGGGRALGILGLLRLDILDHRAKLAGGASEFRPHRGALWQFG
jgi:hypothetical protein